MLAFHQIQDPINDEELSPALGAKSSGMGVVVPIQEVGKRTGTSTTDPRVGIGIGAAGDPTYTLQASAQHGVVAFTPSQGGRSMPVGAIAPTLVAGTGNKAPAILVFNVKQDGADADEIAPTLLAMPRDESHANGGGQLGVVCATGDVTHSLTHEGHDASEDGTGRGTPIVAAALTTNYYADREGEESKIVVGTLDARTNGGGFPGSDGAMDGHVQAPRGIPRRLTPRECERLMSWPDDHTLVPNASGKLLSDSARYKICGNGVASVHTHWIGWRLALALDAA